MTTTRLTLSLLFVCAGLGACSGDSGGREASTAAQVVLPKPSGFGRV